MEQNKNVLAPEASTDERASSLDPAAGASDALAFDAVELRYRSDGWTPERQREFVEALADCGVIRQAAGRVGMTERSVSRLRRRPEARAFDAACTLAQRIGAPRLLSVAFERAIEGTVRRRYYHGELKSEERVYDNKLLMFLITKFGRLLEPRPESLGVEANWELWMNANRTRRAAARAAAFGRRPLGRLRRSRIFSFYGSRTFRTFHPLAGL